MSVSVNFMLENYCSNNCETIINWFIYEAIANYSHEIKNLKINLIEKGKYYVNVFNLSFQLNEKNVNPDEETAFIIAEGILDPRDSSDYPDVRSNNLPVAYMVEGSFLFLGQPAPRASPKRTRCRNGQRKNKSRVCVDYVKKPRTRCPNGERKNKSRVCIKYR